MKTIVGTCLHCGINIWEELGNKPILPCEVSGCPYETPEEQEHMRLHWMKVQKPGLGGNDFE